MNVPSPDVWRCLSRAENAAARARWYPPEVLVVVERDEEST